jgi:hypothetical protein
MKVIIEKKIKNAMQSGSNLSYYMIKPYIEENYRFSDMMTAWNGIKTTLSQIKIKFDTLDDAEKYAKKQGYEVISTSFINK